MVKICVEKFAIQYGIDIKDWLDPDLFLFNDKQAITKVRINRQYNNKLVLSCTMEKVDLKGREVIVKQK